MAGNLNTNKQVTNSQFINLCCYIEDLPAVNRMFQHDLNKFGPGVDAPMWQKERFYAEWLEMDFSIPNWIRIGSGRADLLETRVFRRISTARELTAYVHTKSHEEVT